MLLMLDLLERASEFDGEERCVPRVSDELEAMSAGGHRLLPQARAREGQGRR